MEPEGPETCNKDEMCSPVINATPAGVLSPTKRTPSKNNPSIAMSPCKKLASDRFIPLRETNCWQSRIAMTLESKTLFKKGEGASPTGKMYTQLLRNEIFEEECTDSTENHNIIPKSTRLFQFASPTKENKTVDSSSEIYSVSPLGKKSRQLLQTPKKSQRKIPHIPFKVLDAPELQDDFYLNLLDWSAQNMLGVGLGSSVYLWSATTSQVTRLCELDNGGVTSVCWNNKGNTLAVGNTLGYTHIWDIGTMKKIHVLPGHVARIGTLAWNDEDLLASGSRDRIILLRDLRSPRDLGEKKYTGHRQEVCGLKWSPDGLYLASGGNDNKVCIWGLSYTTPMQSYVQHTAAVKAIAWSPHHHGLLASGGGTADRCIRFWNTLTGQALQAIDTGSQVCNILWAKNTCELVSTHGYSQNQICLWNYPNMTQIAKLMGHSLRVLYLAMSPNGETIVTGAGDETLRFWNVFSKPQSQKEKKSALNLFSGIR